jgi:hypothetical protein
MQLIRRNALLAGTHEKGGLKPLVEFQVRRLEHGSLSDRELSATVVTLPQAKPDTTVLTLHTFQTIDPVGCFAMWATWSLWP